MQKCEKSIHHFYRKTLRVKSSHWTLDYNLFGVFSEKYFPDD